MKKKTKKQKSLGKLKRDFDSVFSKWVRLKDSKDGMCMCITCGVWKKISKQQCGHYTSRSYLSTRFDPKNTAVQCYQCNICKKGNIDEYALWLIGTYGEGILEELNKKKWETRKYSRLEYNSFIQIYKDKIKRLEDDGKFFS